MSPTRVFLLIYEFLYLYLKVPPGVSVTVDEKGSSKLLANLDKLGDEVTVASGGIGGGPSNGWLGQNPWQWPLSTTPSYLASLVQLVIEFMHPW